MNYLTNSKLLDDAFRHTAETVLVNDVPQQAIINMAHLGERERRHIASLEPLKSGDYIKHKEHMYIIAQEVETTRHNKYRSAMELCNYTFTFEILGEQYRDGTDQFGKPIWKNHPSTFFDVPAFAQNLTNKITYEAWSTQQNTIVASVQSNAVTLEHMKLNVTTIVRGRKYGITHIDKLVEGVLHLTLAFQSS